MKLRRNVDKPISVILADDQQEVRGALRRSMERDGRFEIVAEAENGDEAIGAVSRLQPDAMILDLAMPHLDGLAALPRIRMASPRTKVLVLSSMVPFGDAEHKAILAGAAAAFDKYTSPRKLIAKVVTETAGGPA